MRHTRLLVALVAMMALLVGAAHAEELVTMTKPNFYDLTGIPPKTQEELDNEAGEGYTSAVLNDDGSITYTVTRAVKDEMLQEFRQFIDETLEELISSGDCPNYGRVERNEDVTRFEVFVNSEGITAGDLAGVPLLFWYSDVYWQMKEDEPDDVVVAFINTDGNTVYEARPSDFEFEIRLELK